jgi:hypothetical protein
MMEESEIWRAAGLLVDQQGADALRVAERLSAELELQGDQVGAANWRQIAEAVKALTEAPSHVEA